MFTSSLGATPTPIRRVALVATLSILAAAAVVAWPSTPSTQPLYSSDAAASSKEFAQTQTSRLAANGSATL